MQRCFQVALVVAGMVLWIFAGGSGSQAGGLKQCGTSSCLAYCQGYCDNTRVRCKETGSKARECRGRGYRSCMNGCTWEICKMRPSDRPSYQCKRHPDLAGG